MYLNLKKYSPWFWKKLTQCKISLRVILENVDSINKNVCDISKTFTHFKKNVLEVFEKKTYNIQEMVHTI